jgi:ankyrin repeat protein
LLQAIALKDGAAVRGILSRRATPVNVADGTDYNQNPILLASVQGEMSIIKVLLDAGANIEARGQFGMTALMLATLKGNTKVVELLLARGAKVDARADNGATALMTAARDNFPDLVELLIGHGADVNAATKQAFTPLMAAADDEAIVLLLLKSGAKSEATNSEGQTAACLSAKQKQSKKTAALARHDPTAARPCAN